MLLALACTANAETITGLVVGVSDGDTITVLDANKVQHKIRLAGIDAPEKKQTDKLGPATVAGDWAQVDQLVERVAVREKAFAALFPVATIASDPPSTEDTP